MMFYTPSFTSCTKTPSEQATTEGSMTTSVFRVSANWSHWSPAKRGDSDRNFDKSLMDEGIFFSEAARDEASPKTFLSRVKPFKIAFQPFFEFRYDHYFFTNNVYLVL